MRVILPITSAITAIRSQFSRSMSASNFQQSSDTNIRYFLKDVYQKNPRNVFSIYVTGGGNKALEWLFTVPGTYVNTCG
jgi:hypothetical protein